MHQPRQFPLWHADQKYQSFCKSQGLTHTASSRRQEEKVPSTCDVDAGRNAVDHSQQPQIKIPTRVTQQHACDVLIVLSHRLHFSWNLMIDKKLFLTWHVTKERFQVEIFYPIICFFCSFHSSAMRRCTFLSPSSYSTSHSDLTCSHLFIAMVSASITVERRRRLLSLRNSSRFSAKWRPSSTWRRFRLKAPCPCTISVTS